MQLPGKRMRGQHRASHDSGEPFNQCHKFFSRGLHFLKLIKLNMNPSIEFRLPTIYGNIANKYGK
jgi:hypothetical protein